jgi:hypothetical protein
MSTAQQPVRSWAGGPGLRAAARVDERPAAARFPLGWPVAARLGGERLALVAVGIVAGSAAIAAVLGGRLVIQDRAVAQATAALAPADRSLEVAWFGAFGGTWRSLDRAVAPALLASTGREPPGDALSRVADRRPPRQSAGRGRARPLRPPPLGRLPRRCVPSHCEVLRIAGPGPIPSKPTLRLIQVGRARLDPDAPFAPFIQPQTTPFVARALRYHTPQPSPVLLADGVDGLSRTSELSSFFRSYAWFVPVEPGDVHPWSVAAYAHGVADLRTELAARSDRFQVTAPTDELATAHGARRLLLETQRTRANTDLSARTAAVQNSAQALDVLQGEAPRGPCAPLAGRAEHVRRDRCGRARRHDRRLVIGGAVAAAAASRAGSPPGRSSSMPCSRAAGCSPPRAPPPPRRCCSTSRWRARAAGRPADLTPLDVAGLAAVAVVVVGTARGAVDTSSLATGGGSETFVLLVPALVTFAAAVAAVRLLVPALRGIGRIGRSGPLAPAGRPLAGPEPGRRDGGGDVPGCEPGPRPLRPHISLDVDPRPGGRGRLRRPGPVRRRRGPLAARPGSPRLERAPGDVHPAALGQCPHLDGLHVPRRARGSAAEDGRVAQRLLPAAAVAARRGRRPGRRHGPRLDGPARGPDVRAAGVGDRRPHRRARVLPLAARRLRRRRPRRDATVGPRRAPGPRPYAGARLRPSSSRCRTAAGWPRTAASARSRRRAASSGSARRPSTAGRWPLPSTTGSRRTAPPCARTAGSPTL